MNSQEQMSVYQEMYDKGWLNYAEYHSPLRKAAYYGKMSQLINTARHIANTGRRPQRRTTCAQAEFRNTDWFKELFRNSVHAHATRSASPPAPTKSSYYASRRAPCVDPGWTQVQSKVEPLHG